MAANTEEENVVEQLQKQVETLRETEIKVRNYFIFLLNYIL